MPSFRIRVAALVVLVSTLASSCTSSLVRDANRLAQLPPLPYRIAVVGGAFLPDALRAELGRKPLQSDGAVPSLWSRTFEPGQAEPIAFDAILRLLRRGRAATRILNLSMPDSAFRELLANRDGAGLERAQREAEQAGADLVLVIEGLREGPVQFLGVTGQWPITTVAWLLAGLGVFVPDHRYQSKVKLRASLRDVHSGRALMSGMLFSPAPLELALWDRSDFFGIVSSILVPPSLVGDDVAAVVEEVRRDGAQKLLLALLARLKDPETLETLRARMPLRLRLRIEAGQLLVELRTQQELQDLLVEGIAADGSRQAMSDADFLDFRRAFLAGSVHDSDGFSYRGKLPLKHAARELRVLVQDVAGQRASASLRSKR